MPGEYDIYDGAAASPAHAGEQPPCDIEAEKSVLSACLLSAEAAEEIAIALEPQNFYRQSHKNIFAAMYDIVKDGGSPDLITLTDKMRAAGTLSQASDEAYLASLASATYSMTNWRKHAEIVKRCAIQRDLIKAGAEIQALGYNGPDSITEVVGQAEKTLFGVTEKRVSSSFVSMGDLCTQVFDELSKTANKNGELLGVPTGFADLDKLFCGLRGGDLVIIAARPGVGKTSFALNLAVNAAKRGTNVAFFSLEMSKEQIMQRILCSEAQVELSKIRSLNLSQSDWAQLTPRIDGLASLHMAIDDTPGLSILEARAKARRQLRNLKEKGQKGLVVVDYLQLMQPPVTRRDGNRAVEVGEISRGLKILAKELDVPVIALSQLSRSIEQRNPKTKRPMLSDLRESGSIEQDADIVMFIDRSMDEEEAAMDSRPDLGTAEIQVAKHRNGPTRDVTLAFRGEFTRFSDFVDDARYQ